MKFRNPNSLTSDPWYSMTLRHLYLFPVTGSVPLRVMSSQARNKAVISLFLWEKIIQISHDWDSQTEVIHWVWRLLKGRKVTFVIISSRSQINISGMIISCFVFYINQLFCVISCREIVLLVSNSKHFLLEKNMGVDYVHLLSHRLNKWLRVFMCPHN